MQLSPASAALAAALVLAPSAWSQSAPAGPFAPGPGAASCLAWDSIPFSTAGTLVTEGFLVAQSDPVSGVSAFSASARTFTSVAPAGSTILGSGDWCLLVRTNTGAMRAYSARTNASATLPLPAGSAPVFFDAHDDVAFVVTTTLTGATTAWGYSAARGAWVPQPLSVPATAADTVISRFVVGVRDGDSYHGFSARTGAWETITGPGPGATLSADGNTLLADFASPGLAPIVLAFSGVRGCWTPAPLLFPGSTPSLDHNVAYVEAEIGSSAVYEPVAYSAYRAEWVPSVPRPFGATLVLSDNCVVLEHPDPAFRLDAFGAGHGGWALLAGDFAGFYVEEDLATAIDLATTDVLGFSGLCGGAWMPEANPSGAAPLPLLGPDHIGGFDAGTSMHIFLPKDNTWAPSVAKSPGDPVVPADEVVEVLTPTKTLAIDTRNGVWMSSPPLTLPGVGTGSVIAHQDAAGTVDLFDERCGDWNPPHALSAPSALVAGRNLVVAAPDPTSGVASKVEAYSVQRCDWTTPGAVPLPLALGPIAEENVAAFVDAAGILWAYGSANDGHSFYQWPNGTEYHVSGKHTDPSCRSTLLGYGVRATPGSFSYVVLGPSLSCPPIVFPGIGGALWMPIAGSSLYATLGFHDPDQMLEYRTVLATALPMCLQAWFQPLTFDAGTLALTFGCRRADAVWVF